jgi:hypothetical protein
MTATERQRRRNLKSGVFRVITALVALIFVLAWSAFVWTLAREYQYRAQSAEEQTEKHSGSGDRQSEDRCAIVRGIGDAIDCLVQKIAASRETQRAEQDLAAQQSMADWALWMVVLTAMQAALSLVGVVLLVRNLSLVNESNANALDAVREAEKANKIAEDTDKRQLRAYLSVSPKGINSLKVRSAVVGHVVIRNVGQIIAQKVRATVRMDTSEDKLRSAFQIDKTLFRTIGSVHPNVEIGMGSYETLHEKQLVPSQGKREYVYVWGRIVYEDGFDQPRFTDFCFRYNTESRTVTKRRPIIKIDAARYHHSGNDAN